MTEVQRYAKVPADMSRDGWSRTAGHVATAGQVAGRASSAAGALDDLAAQLQAMAARRLEAPAFAWDADNGCLHVSVPDAVTGDYAAYIVRFPADGSAPCLSTCVTSGAGPAAEAFSRSVGLEPVTTRRS